MKAAIVLLASTPIQNFIRRIVFELNANYGAAFFASLLPSHVSLKQPFAFEDMDVNLMFDERLGIILGSFASGIVGYIMLRVSLRSNNQLNKDAPKSGAPVN